MRNRRTRSRDPVRPSLVRSVDHALALLDLLADGTGSWGISECARATGLSKAAVFRLVRTLERHGYIVQTDGRRYALGTKPLELAGVVLRRFEVRDVARPTMLALAERTGESVVLTAPGRDGVICLDTVDSPQRIRASFQIGRVTPWHAGAAGKLHLAFLPEGRMREIMARGLPRYTERTMTDPAALRRDLVRIRRQGYAFTVGEFDPGVAAITAPIRDSRGEVVAAISIGGPAARFSADALPALIRHVREAAEEVSLRLLGGHRAVGQARPA
ncbi:MAG: IclR family transcriptional regulator [Armatimonadota bacterium]|nr:IclR family transcriptional regulator [Armatimonadota bacterium]MDR7518136.1 IclR family transcriptional regulator [Armatimonadota bacterium]MDR7550281.1 IclR family transcriptional regulator [Armatimonadota bacterium]